MLLAQEADFVVFWGLCEEVEKAICKWKNKNAHF